MSLLQEMARLLAAQKLVPFFGAGISRPHLGFAGPEMAAEMAQLTGVPVSTPLAAAGDRFIERFGEEAFTDYLKSRLLAVSFDEAKGSSYQLLLSLSCNALYTTNQDNQFELCAEKYGRPYRRIVTINDISEVKPGEPRLYKYHGDLGNPESLVFTSRQYARRIEDARNPLNIRLMSDLIGKSLLFVGYSFQDENVQKLFNEIRHAFDGKMPSSYLISFDESGELENTCHEFGIKFLLPRRHFPDEQTDREAFERCLKSLCDLTVQFQGEQELENLFSPPTPRAERMVTPYEVEAVAAAIAAGDIDVSLNTFRGTIVHSLIPESVQMGVVDIFTKLTVSADMANPGHVQCLRVCLMSLRLPAALAAQVMASFMAALNQRPAQVGSDELMTLNSHALPEGFVSVAAALAITMLNDRAEAITDGFRRTAHWWFQDYSLAPPELGEQIRQAVNLAWSGTRAADSPLEYWKKFGGLLRMKTAKQIANEMMEMMPHKLRAPSDSL